MLASRPVSQRPGTSGQSLCPGSQPVLQWPAGDGTGALPFSDEAGSGANPQHGPLPDKEATLDWLQALALGLVQGLSEFLPISSSGHLVLLPALLKWAQPPLVFDTTVHLGTLAALVAVFWRELRVLARAWWRGLQQRQPLATPESRLAWWIILATVPAALAGVLLERSFEQLFGSSRAVGAFLLLTALFLLLAERLGLPRRDLERVTWLDALLIGIGQAAAILPGLSRSGATIATGMLRGLDRRSSARFSFLLSIPIVAGTGIYQLARLALHPQGTASLPPLLIGFLGAALAGYAAIRLFLSYLRRRPLYPFAAYCALIGLLAIFFL